MPARVAVPVVRVDDHHPRRRGSGAARAGVRLRRAVALYVDVKVTITQPCISKVEAHITAYGIFWRILVAEIERC